jgi:predicted DCC family thiol-disulfide oxidoreductase YuxK
MSDDGPILLFDGVCNLCNWGVGFILRHERRGLSADGRMRFAPLQSVAASRLLAGAGVSDPASLGETMIVIDTNGRVLTRSDAAARIARTLRSPWRWAAAARVLPRFVRDRLYGLVARNRYRWFGKRDSCMMPTEALRARFLAEHPTGPSDRSP